MEGGQRDLPIHASRMAVKSERWDKHGPENVALSDACLSAVGPDP